MTSQTPPPPLRTGRLFRHPPLRRAGRERAAQAYWAAYQDRFEKHADMVAWLDAITMPASGNWVYGRIPKTGTNSVLAALHQLEFGAPISTSISEENNTSPDTAPHHLDEAGVFMSTLQTQHTPAVLENAFRFTVLRDPVKRALSSFLYLGRSHVLATRQLAPVRLRMSAETGFDWNKDAHTRKGFEMMLDFIESMQSISRLRLDRHIAPQTASMDPSIFRPHLTGRTEEMGSFLAQLSDHFGAELPQKIAKSKRNQTPKPETAIRLTKAIRSRVETIFAADMEWYDSL
ncbi:sulfotransferase family 2 domain-containing protein [Aliishimia ponticola]|nr:sulfotransferase family 2 domain-containing protein [Aliishimia ponticola]